MRTSAEAMPVADEAFSPTKAAKPLHGTVDEMKDAILGLLEGGAEAFKMRQRRYGPLVK